MGIFNRVKKKEEPSDNGPLCISIHSFESKSDSEIIASCDIKTGTVHVGDTLIYRPHFGRDVEVTVKGIVSMMMNLEKAYEGTAATIILSGSFTYLVPSYEDIIIRE